MSHPALARTRPYRRLRAAIAAAAAASILVALSLINPLGARADEDYPSWDDVRNARTSEQAKQTEVRRIQDLVTGLKTEVAQAQALALQRGNEYQAAQQAFDDADYKLGQLQDQAAEAKKQADDSNRQAGIVAAQLARTGGSDASLGLLTGGGASATQLLYQLGTMSKLTEKTAGIYAQAQQDRNTSQALTDQASVARNVRQGLSEEAQRLAQQAVTAQQAVETALTAQTNHEVDLNTQLAVLTQNREATEADYQAGVDYRNAQAAAAAAAAAAAGMSYPSATGWASPFPKAHSSDEFGMRVNPVSGAWLLHSGLDLVYNGGTCGATVFAAKDGTVNYAGSNGGYGNFIQIDHGGGWASAYGHNTTLLVQVGQQVDAGEPIAYAGTTGNSTGCHLHFEIRKNGTAQDPRTFMAGNDINFG